MYQRHDGRDSELHLETAAETYSRMPAMASIMPRPPLVTQLFTYLWPINSIRLMLTSLPSRLNQPGNPTA